MRFEKLSLLSLVCLSLSIPMSAHALVAAPAKNNLFDAGTLSGSWIATRCEETINPDHASTDFVPLHVTITLAGGALTASHAAEDAGHHFFDVTFGSINQGKKTATDASPQVGVSKDFMGESYTFSRGIYKIETATDGRTHTAMIETGHGGEEIDFTVSRIANPSVVVSSGADGDHSITCHYKHAQQ